MYRAFPNIAPVANKYLEHKTFLKKQAEHEKNIKNARGVVNRSEPTPRPHCSQRVRQKQMREHELAMIEKDNQRLRDRISKNGSSIDTHNKYVVHSLNTEKRQRQQAEHDVTLQRLQKLLSKARTSYPVQEFQQDYAGRCDIQRRMSRFSAKTN